MQPVLWRPCTSSGGPGPPLLAYAATAARAPVLGPGPPAKAPGHQMPRPPFSAAPLGLRDRRPRDLDRARSSEPVQRLLSVDPLRSLGASNVDRIQLQRAPARGEVGAGQRALVEHASLQLQVP